MQFGSTRAGDGSDHERYRLTNFGPLITLPLDSLNPACPLCSPLKVGTKLTCGLVDRRKGVEGQPARRKNLKLGGSTMKISLKQTIVALAAVAVLGTGSLFASPAAPSHESSSYLSARASTLLAEIQEEAVGLNRQAETLGTFARNPQFSWQSHAHYLDRVKGHINEVTERTAELQRISASVLPWQQQAITEVTSHAAQVANSTQAAIVHLRENQNRLFVPEYREHLTTIANRSEDMKQTVDKFLNYEKAQQKFQQLQNELELSGG